MTYTCTQCNYTWTPRPKRFEQDRDKPVACPSCQSRDWDKDMDELIAHDKERLAQANREARLNPPEAETPEGHAKLRKAVEGIAKNLERKG